MRYSIVIALALASATCLPWECVGQQPPNPTLALWKNLKRALMAPDGPDYFEMGMKDAVLPTLKGKVVSLEPETNPTRILLSMEDGAAPEVTLRLDVPLEGTVAIGTKLSFEGIGESFT